MKTLLLHGPEAISGSPAGQRACAGTTVSASGLPHRRRLAAHQTWTIVAVAFAGLLVTSCSIPLPQAEKDPTRFYVLSMPASSAAATPSSSAPSIHLRQVEVASYLRAPTLIIRKGNNEVEFREYARWGEPLEQGISRVLREALVARGAARTVLTPGLRAMGTNYDYELSVRVLTCEGGKDGSVQFRAIWELTSGAAHAPSVKSGDFRATGLTWDGKGEASLAAALSEAVSALAGEIAAAIAQK